MRIETIDLQFQGSSGVTAAYLVAGETGHVLVESGPGSTLQHLLAGLAKCGLGTADIAGIIVTHIHLDHAGAAGWWTQQGVPVYVHQLGAPHLIDPSRLLASAGRIYGDNMDSLWGEMLPAVPKLVHALADGDVMEIAGMTFIARETPGHANHHHAIQINDVVFAGDVAGVRVGGVWTDLPAPPPEFDLEKWLKSLHKLRQLPIGQLYLTHFGVVEDAAAHLDEFEARLRASANLIRKFVKANLSREEMIRAYRDWIRKEASAAGIPAEFLKQNEKAIAVDMSVDGMARYWRRQAT